MVSDTEDDTETAVGVPLATALRVAASGVNLDDGRGGVIFVFLLAGCTLISCEPIHNLIFITFC